MRTAIHATHRQPISAAASTDLRPSTHASLGLAARDGNRPMPSGATRSISPSGGPPLILWIPRPENHPMAKNRSIQTFEKRRRERDKQMKHHAKLEERHSRKAQKRAAKLEAEVRGNGVAPAPVQTPGGSPLGAPANAPVRAPLHAPARAPVTATVPASVPASVHAPVPAHIQTPAPKRANNQDLVT